ncbi:zinc ABC transporter substrate-binding protein [Aestuariirhabdus sp. Z084]|uniref:zinc ABC transporter substrate-binding protein n=1 Tax=Aestuariirhabdus haliotis TaxID=2918751 RepID=UPI00201B3CA6|nr:zinc ABC transporter substrate-binding protein [Aestuariirhabdus haliotis]MCL6414283.1 zinc ABC transporter substrate-binding protein [Aestuariirhabdus haliotis]MCL6418215.1 zinc ABC transporter substrate-binding protein [Aestuariirhabdus haliotis]
MMRFLCSSLGALLLCLSMSAQADIQPVKVMTSIKPLQLIAAAITDGVSQPELLVPVGASPHGYSLRPSDLKRLADAQVVFWIGPAMEPYLQKLLSNRTDGIRVQQFVDAGESQAHDDHDDHHGHNHEHDHEEGTDLHLWLNPDEGREIAVQMTRVLVAADPAFAQTYQENLERFEQGLDNLVAENRLLLQVPAQREIFVFHDAYQGLEAFYGIQVEGAITLSPEMQPGTRHLVSVRERLLAAGESCLFTEPQFQSAMLNRLVTGLEVQVAQLDPLAGDIEPNATGYFQHQRQLIATIAECTRPTTR